MAVFFLCDWLMIRFEYISCNRVTTWINKLGEVRKDLKISCNQDKFFSESLKLRVWRMSASSCEIVGLCCCSICFLLYLVVPKTCPVRKLVSNWCCCAPRKVMSKRSWTVQYRIFSGWQAPHYLDNVVLELPLCVLHLLVLIFTYPYVCCLYQKRTLRCWALSPTNHGKQKEQ